MKKIFTIFLIIFSILLISCGWPKFEGLTEKKEETERQNQMLETEQIENNWEQISNSADEVQNNRISEEEYKELIGRVAKWEELNDEDLQKTVDYIRWIGEELDNITNNIKKLEEESVNTRITLAQFNELRVWMTGLDVWNTIWALCPTTSDLDLAGIRTTMFTCRWEWSIWANAILTIQDWKLVQKTQIWLK
jgi:hypothetical protein